MPEKMRELWNKEMNFEQDVFPNWRQVAETYFTNAIAGEAGELCNASKKRKGGGTNNYEISKEEMLEEAVDVFIYLIIYSEYLGFSYDDFAQALEDKINKNWQRKEDGKVSKIKIE